MILAIGSPGEAGPLCVVSAPLGGSPHESLTRHLPFPAPLSLFNLVAISRHFTAHFCQVMSPGKPGVSVPGRELQIIFCVPDGEGL